MKKLWYIIFPKKYYWYRVRYEYKKKNDILFSWNTSVGVSKQDSINNSREIKLIPPPLHKSELVGLSSLCNGDLYVEPVCYLGYFKNG